MDVKRPKPTHVLPCWPVGKPCPNSCAQAVMDQITSNHIDLGGDWFGWRMAGKDLVSPEGTRISPTRMKGILWRIQAEERLAKAAARNAARKAVRRGDVKVLVVPNEDWHPPAALHPRLSIARRLRESHRLKSPISVSTKT